MMYALNSQQKHNGNIAILSFPCYCCFMLKIRLKRVGRKHDPSFRIIVTESTKGPKSGNYIEMVGAYDPRKNTRTVKEERVQYWLSHGAQPSDTVYNILVTEGILTGPKRNVLPKKTPIIKEAPAQETASAEQETPVAAAEPAVA